MKKFALLSVSLSVFSISGLAQAADFNTLTTPSQTPQAPAASVQATAPTQAKTIVEPKKTGPLKGGAYIVPDKTPAPAQGNTFTKSDQGYSKMSAYNVVNDQNKPVTNDWTRPKSWRIGYKNKNRTPINE